MAKELILVGDRVLIEITEGESEKFIVVSQSAILLLMHDSLPKSLSGI